ncbi:hypothetical protein SLA2020_447210 [Shorea laevis]
MNGATIHICASSSPGDVGRHNYPLFGPSILARDPSWTCARSPHLRLDNGFDTICNNSPTPPTDTILSAFASLNQTSQEVTHSDTTPA